MNALSGNKPPFDTGAFVQRCLGNLFGGITSAIVMLPMALAFGVASGLGPLAGLYGAIAVGFFAALFGGTPAQISGPTGPMTVAMTAIVTIYADSLASAFTIVMLAGVLQIFLGLSRLGSFIQYTSYSVIAGFLTGIGLIIIVLHVNPWIGVEIAKGSVIQQVSTWGYAIVNIQWQDFSVGVIALIICFFWPKKLRSYLPAPLVAMTVGTLIALLFLRDVTTIGSIPSGMPSLYTPEFQWNSIADILSPALMIALLGSIDSLLTSLVADTKTRTRHNPNRELIGQGIGNVAAGMVGGLPGAGATMGTLTNVGAGGRSRISGMLAALLLLGLLVWFGGIAEPVPLSVLAAVLIRVGVDIIEWRFVTRLLVIRREYVVVMLITFFMTILFDLILAVALGIIVAGIVQSRRLGGAELDSVQSIPLINFLGAKNLDEIDTEHVPVCTVNLKGRFSIGSSNKLASAIAADIVAHDVIILNFEETTDIDDSAAIALDDVVISVREANIPLIVSGQSEEVAGVLSSLRIFDGIPNEHIVADYEEATRLARELLTQLLVTEKQVS